MHQTNEYLELDKLDIWMKIYLDAIYRLANRIEMNNVMYLINILHYSFLFLFKFYTFCTFLK